MSARNLEPPAPRKNDRIAAGEGVCYACKGTIRVGSRFRWEGQPVSPLCNSCIEKRENRDSRMR
jgi:hypothetical protein